MKTSSIIRAAALVIAWATVSAIASGQALGSTADDKSLAMGAETAITHESEAAIEKMGEWLGTFDKVRGGLERNDGFIRSDDELVLAFLFQPMEGESMLLRTYMNSVVNAMEQVPDTFYTTLDAKVEALWSEIIRVAPTVSPVNGAEADASVRSAVEKRVVQGAPDAKVLRTVMTSEKWNVRMSEAGMPKSEYRKGHVMYRLPNQQLIVCQQIVVERPYFSGSEKEYSVKLGYLRMQVNP